MKKHEGFSSRIGFVLAAAGSAVGLGNIWRFPYLAAKFGGGIFLLTYLVLVLTFGYSLLISEIALGRMTRKGPVGAYRDVCAGKGISCGFLRIGGWLNAFVPLIILPYYCVIGGWVTKYAVVMCSTPISKFAQEERVLNAAGAAVTASEHYFSTFISSTWEPLIYLLVFLGILAVVVAFGVEKGIERFNKILMPALLVLIVAICIYCLFLPNAADGLKFYLLPDPDKFSYMTLVAALGQLFFSLSIAMGIMITYGSYMRREDDLISSVNQIEFFDTLVAFLAGLMIIPAVVAFGGREAAENAGVGLVFITMPQVFASFPFGQLVGAFFFFFVLFAAATSAISLLETNVQTVTQELKISRGRAITFCSVETVGIGIITVLGYSVLSSLHPLRFIPFCKDMDILDSFDFVSNSILMPIGAIFTTVLVVAIIGLGNFSREIRQEKTTWVREYVYRLCMTAIVIPCLLIVLLHSTGLLR